jgi:hypothetical protein
MSATPALSEERGESRYLEPRKLDLPLGANRRKSQVCHERRWKDRSVRLELRARRRILDLPVGKCFDRTHTAIPRLADR